MISAGSADATFGATITVNGSVAHTMIGVASCRAFREAIGRTIGDDVRDQVNAMIAAH
jgi:hypothetical protein